MRDENEIHPTGIDRRHLLGGTAKVAALAGLTGAIGGAAVVTAAAAPRFGAGLPCRLRRRPAERRGEARRS